MPREIVLDYAIAARAVGQRFLADAAPFHRFPLLLWAEDQLPAKFSPLYFRIGHGSFFSLPSGIRLNRHPGIYP